MSNLFRQPTQNGQLTSEKYIPFLGDQDNFPLQWSKTISESPSSSSCLSVVQDFMQGFGFSDTDLENKIINSKGETFFQLHQQTTDCYSEFCGYYWLCKFNMLGIPTEYELIPFESCRLGKPDSTGFISKIFYNPFFGTEFYKGNSDPHTIIYDVFNLNGVKEQIQQHKDKFKGQMYFYGKTTPQSRFYPINETYSARKWMKIESGVSDYHEDNISNGFLQTFMLIMKGNPNEPSQNPAYSNTNSEHPFTVGEEFNEVVGKNFMGAKRVGNMFVQWVGMGEEKPEVLELPSNSNGDLFITIDNQATKKITIAWKVPAVLANIHEGVSLGGDANQIRVAVKLMQHRVIKRQRTLTDNYSYMLRIMAQPYVNPVVIVPWNPFPELEVIDDKIWQAMTVEERRAWIQENTEIELLPGDEQVLEEPTVPQAKFSNTVPVPFPDSVRDNVKRTLDYMEKMGVKCGGKGGVDVANMILQNQNMGLKQLKRIHSYLKKRGDLENLPYDEDCEVIKYKQWGGKAMFDFLDTKLKDLDAWLN